MRFLLRPLLSRYHSILRRIHELEVAFDALLLEPQWRLDASRVLNGQSCRRAIIDALFVRFKFDEVIETGTFLGYSTGYFAQLVPQVPVRSCELSARFSAVARQRLSAFSNVTVANLDSRAFVETLPVA